MTSVSAASVASRNCRAASLPRRSPRWVRPPRTGGRIVRAGARWISRRADARSGEEEFVAVKIRLMRVGKKKQPTYRVVVADARSPARRPHHRDHRPLRPAPGAVVHRHRRRPRARLAAQGRPAHGAGAEAADRVGRVGDVHRRAAEPRHEAQPARPRHRPRSGEDTVKAEKPAPEPKADRRPRRAPRHPPRRATMRPPRTHRPTTRRQWKRRPRTHRRRNPSERRGRARGRVRRRPRPRRVRRDEIAGEGNRVAGARAQAVTEFLARELAEDSDAIDVTVSERARRDHAADPRQPRRPRAAHRPAWAA